jgi:hypothetical protein
MTASQVWGNISTADPLDYLLVAGMMTPGVVTLSGHDRVIGWKVQEADGQNGASTKRNGKQIAKFTATFFLVDDSDRAEWDSFQTVLESWVDADTPIAVDVYHPDLARNRISAVQISKIGGMTHDGKGGSTVVVEFLEFRPPKPKPTKGSDGSSADDPKPTDPNQALKDELAGLTSEAKQP